MGQSGTVQSVLIVSRPIDQGGWSRPVVSLFIHFQKEQQRSGRVVVVLRIQPTASLVAMNFYGRTKAKISSFHFPAINADYGVSCLFIFRSGGFSGIEVVCLERRLTYQELSRVC